MNILGRGRNHRHLPGYHPDWCEDDQHGLAGSAVLGVSEELGQLQQRVATVVDDEDQGSDPDKVRGPAEPYESDSGLVVDEHLPEIFSLHIEELAEGKRPVESHLDHVVEPDISGHLVMGIFYEAAVDIPQPVLGPENDETVQEDSGVENKPERLTTINDQEPVILWQRLPPACFAELL